LLHETILETLSSITQEEQAILQGRTVVDRSLYMDGSVDVITGAKLLESGKLITVRPHTRFIRFPAHTHDYVEIVYMCAGQTTHIVGGRTITLKAGELLLIGQHTTQEILKANETDIAVNFIIRPEFFGETLPYLGSEDTPLRKFITSCLCGGQGSGYLYFQVADVLPVQNLVENLLWTLISDTPYKRGINQMTMGLLFVQLMNHTDRLQMESAEEEAVLKVLRYIEDNYRSGSLAEIARLVHYDFTSLSRRIKGHTGKTYTELVQEKRLSQAAWMLKNTDETVTDIALSVGYENISYFYRAFSKRYGATPREYRICK